MTTTQAVIEAIRNVPAGKVAGYGQIAALAGIPKGARLVVRILHTCSGKYDLPWWRIVRSGGGIALPESEGGRLQIERLKNEGVRFKSSRVVDPACFWSPADS